MFYLVKTPWWLKSLYPGCTWQMPAEEKKIYLSFDDGPHPIATPFVLEQLKRHQAKATFFCIGKNIIEFPYLFEQIIMEGHQVGNHTYNHLNGWKTEDEEYINNVLAAKKLIHSNLFRPPYGKASKSQLKLLKTQHAMNAVMWTVLSGDFDRQLSKEGCLQNVIRHASPGSIIVFHDSEKAFEKMEFVLPKMLAHFSEEGYSFQPIKL